MASPVRFARTLVILEITVLLLTLRRLRRYLIKQDTFCFFKTILKILICCMYPKTWRSVRELNPMSCSSQLYTLAGCCITGLPTLLYSKLVRPVGFEPTKAVSKTLPIPANYLNSLWRSANSTYSRMYYYTYLTVNVNSFGGK